MSAAVVPCDTTPAPSVGGELPEAATKVLEQLVRDNCGRINLPEWIEAELIRIALEQARYTKSRAARNLGMPRKRLERRVRKYRLDP